MKRILSLDGGGIRGMLSLQVLAEIESIFRSQNNDESLVLADVFDFFAGTSTGAIIATGLSWGLSVKELEALYLDHGAAMFTREPWYRRWKSKYKAQSIGGFFREFFCEADGSAASLGTDRLRRLLLVVMRNASTGSPWPLTNNPHAKYNRRGRADCNLDIPLWQVLRASTAAPSYFPPQAITLGGRTDLFVDGGVTPFNNPALIALLTATLPAYHVNWPTGPDKIHLVSVGTGTVRAKFPAKIATKIHMLDQIGHVIPAVVGSAAENQDMICRVLGDCLFGAEIDSEVGDLNQPTLLPASQQLFSYVRYNLKLDADDVRQLSAAETKMDNIALMPMLQEIGREFAQSRVKPEHLRPRTT